MESRLKPLDLNRLMEQVVRILKRTIPKMIHIELRLSEPLPKIEGDPVQLEQAAMNLALNARDAMANGGALVISTENVSIDGEGAGTHLDLKQGGYVMLSVTDSGSSIETSWYSLEGADSHFQLLTVNGCLTCKRSHLFSGSLR